MRSAPWLALSWVWVIACGHSYGPPAPPLPPPPAPLSSAAPTSTTITDAPRSPAPDATCANTTTADPELSALRIGFCGCRVMGLRLDPAMSGRAILRATVGTRGEVYDATPVTVEGLPPTVVRCLVDRVRHAHFSPRAATMLVTIPVSFERDANAPGTPASKPRATPLPAGSVDL